MAATGGHWIKSARGSKLDFVPAGGRPQRQVNAQMAAYDAKIIEGTARHYKEMGYVIFPDGTASQVITGGKLSISDFKIRQITGLRSIENAVFTHTHPAHGDEFASTFSSSDIAFASYYNLAEIRAVSLTSSGKVKVYSMKRDPAGRWPRPMAIKGDHGDFSRALGRRARNVSMSAADWYKAHEVYWQEYAKAWGLTYEEHWQ